MSYRSYPTNRKYWILQLLYYRRVHCRLTSLSQVHCTNTRSNYKHLIRCLTTNGYMLLREAKCYGDDWRSHPNAVSWLVGLCETRSEDGPKRFVITFFCSSCSWNAFPHFHNRLRGGVVKLENPWIPISW